MSNNLGMFFLFSVLVTGLIINPSTFAVSIDNDSNSAFSLLTFVFGEETSVNATETMVNATETIVAEDETTSEDETEVPEVVSILSPLKQIKAGITSENVVCKEGLELVFKLNGQAACVKTASVEKLISRGWTQ